MRVHCASVQNEQNSCKTKVEKKKEKQEGKGYVLMKESVV
jgi:hypothetical protein